MDIETGHKENRLFIDFRDTGNRRSFEELFVLVKPWLFNMVYRIVADYDDALDIMQNAWIKLINTSNGFDTGKGNVNNLLFTIAKNEALTWNRKNRILKSGNKKYVGNNGNSIIDDNPETLKLDTERNETIRTALRRLNKNYQDVILLFYYSEFSINEISEQLGVPQGTVKTWLDRGRDKLKKYLKNYFE